ncbi:MAG: tetratricopeptide repeat protein [Planctomycetes bacterium]|nr:tetratricopeptide repeat protein [Planctomycetota bacterium]
MNEEVRRKKFSTQSRQGASTALSDAREALANSYLAAKQFDQAIEALREIVDDKFSDEARVGKAGEAIAKIHLQLGDPKQAVEAYHQLLQRRASDAAARLAQVRNLLAIDPTALGALEKFITNYAGAKSEVLAEAYLMLGAGYEGVGENKNALEAFQRAASLQGAAAHRVAAARVGTARAYHRLGETKKAIDVYRGLLSDPGLEPAQRFAHVKALRQVDPSADVMPDVAVYINAVHRWRDFSLAVLDAPGRRPRT